jgi:hypothetical protein
MRRRWIALLACLAVAGCGSEERLAAGTAERLHDAVATARSAAANGDRDAALRALDRLDRRVREAERAGELAQTDADALRRGVRQARARVRREVEAPAPATTPVPTATAEPTAVPEAPPPGQEKKGKKDEPGKGKDKAKGKGKGK